jgi:parallel beta-helix repeat protein
MPSCSAPRLAAFALAALAFPPAHAETLGCTDVTALPATITAPGRYCLAVDATAAYTVSPVTIAASNVLFDCNGHTITLTGSAAPNGISVVGRHHVSVLGCHLSGFGRGIAFYETTAGTSHDNVVADNEVTRSRVSGIQMAGSSNLVERNRVSENVGGGGTGTYGILVSSPTSPADQHGLGNVVRGNTVSRFEPSAYVRSFGIYLVNVDETVLDGNAIVGLFSPIGTTGIAADAASRNNTARGNSILAPKGQPPGGTPMTSQADEGIRFSNPANACLDNVVGGYVLNIPDETDGAGGCVKQGNVEF